MTRGSTLTVQCILAAYLVTSGFAVRAQTPPPTIPTKDAKKHLGKLVRVCGRVVAVDCVLSQSDLLMNLDRPYWERGTKVNLAVRGPDRAKFPPRFEDDYLGADVCATGLVARVDKQLSIAVERPEDVVVVKDNPAAHGFAPDAVYSCTPGIEMPRLIKEVKPQYTQQAMRSRTEGRILLEAAVLADGRVGDIRIVYGLRSDSGLNEQAAKTVRQWRFEPGQLNGKAVPVIVSIELTYKLR